MIQVTPVILCGGSGTRLWPLSRTGFPKQFLCLTGDESLFQLSAKRLAGLGQDGIQVAAPLIVSGEDHRFLASEQLREVGISLGMALLEPLGRNTAPALTLAALAATENGQDPVLVVTPADQTIADSTAFTAAVQQAIAQAAEGNIVILGVTPDKPETGYGYIRTEQSRSEPLLANVCKVQAFVEKPNLETAQKYLQEGGYFWNAGMFVLRASVWLKALQTFRPDIAQASQAAWATKTQDAQFIRPGKEEFAAIPSESVDYAVMEHCPGSAFPIQMVPLDAGWSDLGAWDAVWNVLPKDAQGNAHTGDVLATDSHNTLVHASSRLVSLVGVSDLVVIETADAVLVVDKSRSQDVKHIVTALGQQKREEQTLHRKVHRPWGWYDSIDEGGRFKVKRIQVKPGASLSLQKHHHRAEHWIVVTGTAEITNGDQVLTLTENQSTYIPLGEVHRLANPGTITLEIIEVQSGSYLGEDDIVRFEDHYGRSVFAGNQKMDSKPIFVTQPCLPPLEEFTPYLQQIWQNKILTNGGPFHQQLEKALREYLGVEHVALFSNGTLALITALQALRITGEVITTPYSFVATAHSLLWNGNKPVFVDVEPETLNLDPAKIEAAITPQTTAIMPVHCYGNPCDVDAIQKIADNYNLKVIYDAAHAFGVQCHCGSVLNHGDLSVLSFHATKVFNTFEGGAIICPDAKTKQRIDHLKNFGFVDETTVVAPGINGKMSEINAAFGMLQLKHMPTIKERRAAIDATYRDGLKGVQGIRCLPQAGQIVANHSYFPILVDDDYQLSRDTLYQKLKEHGVNGRRYFYPLISEFSMYRGMPSASKGNLPVATDAAARVLCLPIYPNLEDAEVEKIINLICVMGVKK